MAVASHADRIITLRDGRVVEDSGHPGRPMTTPHPPHPGRRPTRCQVMAASWPSPVGQDAQGTGAAVRTASRGWDRYREAGRMALHAMLAHRMRTFLTMLGIIIGIAAVVSVVALGQGRAPR